MGDQHDSVPKDTSSTGTAAPFIAIVIPDTSDEGLCLSRLCEHSDIKVLSPWVVPRFLHPPSASALAFYQHQVGAPASVGPTYRISREGKT